MHEKEDIPYWHTFFFIQSYAHNTKIPGYMIPYFLPLPIMLPYAFYITTCFEKITTKEKI